MVYAGLLSHVLKGHGKGKAELSVLASMNEFLSLLSETACLVGVGTSVINWSRAFGERDVMHTGHFRGALTLLIKEVSFFVKCVQDTRCVS